MHPMYPSGSILWILPFGDALMPWAWTHPWYSFFFVSLSSFPPFFLIHSSITTRHSLSSRLYIFKKETYGKNTPFCSLSPCLISLQRLYIDYIITHDRHHSSTSRPAFRQSSIIFHYYQYLLDRKYHTSTYSTY